MAEAHAKQHDYHLVNPSPWPATGAISALVLAAGFIIFMNGDRNLLWIVPGLLGVFYTMYVWWRDVIREAHQGFHSPVVQLHFRYGMILFIASEVMFFVAWFWAFFDASLNANAVFPGHITGAEVGQIARQAWDGGVWPPAGTSGVTEVFDPFHLPLVNTLILLTSGTTVTWAHHSLLHNDRRGLIWGLVLTILLGMTFTGIQVYEYSHAAFSFAGGIYGSTFFMATGFHGAHVLIGTVFLIVCLLRARAGDFTPQQHFGFEAAAWYWHFVDVVWLFLFTFVYVWGGWNATYV
jgi:cytochrome c oxidase subunit 3